MVSDKEASNLVVVKVHLGEVAQGAVANPGCGNESYECRSAGGKAEEQTEDSMRNHRRNRCYTQMDDLGSCEGPAHLLPLAATAMLVHVL